MTTIIKQASKSDKNAIWDFIKSAYGDTAKYKIPDRWHWEYMENPVVDKNSDLLPVFIAIKDGKIVGQVCAILYQVKIGQEMHCMACGVDFIVLPVCRGEGVGQKLIQAIAEKYDLYMVISMGAVTRRIYNRLGYNEIEPIPTYRRLVKLNRAEVSGYLTRRTKTHFVLNRIASIGCRLGFDIMTAVIGNKLILVRNELTKAMNKGSQTEIGEVMHFGDDIDRLWNATNNNFNVIVKRDQKYLNWRFSRESGLDYRCFIGKRDGITRGYIVLRNPAAAELNIGIIVDIYAAPDDNATIEDLIRHAIQFFGDNVTIVECATTQQEHQIALSKLSFLKMERTIPVYFCKDSELKTELEKLKDSWFLTKSDHDWDQLRPLL